MKSKDNVAKLSFLEEIRQSIRESNKEAEQRNSEWEAKRNREWEERNREWEARNREWDKKMQELTDRVNATAAAVDKTNKTVFGISSSNGAMAEEMIFNSLEQDMTFAGIEFYDIRANMQKKIKSKKLEGEYDIVLTNGDTIAIVEAKYKVKLEDVTKLVGENVEKFRELFPEFNNYKILLGIGGMSFDKRAITEAKNKGIGIIKIIGDKVEFHTEGIKIY